MTLSDWEQRLLDIESGKALDIQPPTDLYTKLAAKYGVTRSFVKSKMWLYRYIPHADYTDAELEGIFVALTGI